MAEPGEIIINQYNVGQDGGIDIPNQTLEEPCDTIGEGELEVSKQITANYGDDKSTDKDKFEHEMHESDHLPAHPGDERLTVKDLESNPPITK